VHVMLERGKSMEIEKQKGALKVCLLSRVI